MRAEQWLAAVLDGRDLEAVLTDVDGFVAWLWTRWRYLASAGLDEDELRLIVLGYRREVWLWLAGERMWAQCCSGLIGRITRRIADSPTRRGVTAPERPAPAIELRGVTVRREGVAVLSRVDWRVDARRPLGHPRSQRLGQDDVAPGGSGAALADRWDGGGSRCSPGSCRRPDAASACGAGERSGHAATAGGPCALATSS